MKLIRFIGIDELKHLINRQKVLPIKERRSCLYFFPADGENVPEYEGDTENQTIEYRLSYLSGVVTSYYTRKINDGKLSEIFLCVNLEIQHKDLKSDWKPYADPYGAFFDTITCLEYERREGYNIGNVKSVSIWQQVGDFDYSEIKHFVNLQDCVAWLGTVV